MIWTVCLSTALQLLYRLLSGPGFPAAGWCEAAEHRVPVVGHGAVLQRPREVVPAVEVEADGRGVERRPVRELDARAEVERPREPVLARRVQLVASSGTICVVPGFRPTRPWKIWSTTRSDSPSETSGPSMMTGSAAAPNTSALLACFELVAALAAAATLTLSAAMPTSNPSFFSPMLSYLLLESSIQYSRVSDSVLRPEVDRGQSRSSTRDSYVSSPGLQRARELVVRVRLGRAAELLEAAAERVVRVVVDRRDLEHGPELGLGRLRSGRAGSTRCRASRGSTPCPARAASPSRAAPSPAPRGPRGAAGVPPGRGRTRRSQRLSDTRSSRGSRLRGASGRGSGRSRPRRCGTPSSSARWKASLISNGGPGTSSR